VFVGRDPDPEVDVRRLRDAVAALPDRAENVSFVDLRALPDGSSPELQQGDRVPVAGANRHGAAAVRHAADERDRAGSRRADADADVGGDVDAAVLPAGVRIVAERERAQHRAVDRPAPGERAGSEHQREQG
jgi:hypothetical protein